MITVSVVSNKRMLKDFVNVPNLLYRDDPGYVAQLTLERLDHLGPKNPFFDHVEHAFFVAYKNNKPVGRISAQIDELAQKEDTDCLGHFGFVDAENASVLGFLLDAAETWLAERGVRKVVGPYSLSINDEVGILINGFDSPPRMMMNYAQEWAGSSLEAAGYTPAKDLLAFNMGVDQDFPPAAQRLAKKMESYPGVVLRPLNIRRLEHDIGVILEIFNDAWAGNWGFVPMTTDEIHHVAKNMKPLIKADLVCIAELDGVPVAMIVALPDLNEALAGLDGKLLPFGWAKLLWRLKVKGLRGARVLLMGVRQSHQSGFLGGALAVAIMSKLHQGLRAGNYSEAELSWVLDDNEPMLRLTENIGAKAYRRYRMYEKALPLP